jgi:hypothetical protein
VELISGLDLVNNFANLALKYFARLLEPTKPQAILQKSNFKDKNRVYKVI